MKKTLALVAVIIAGFAYLRFSYDPGPGYIFRTAVLESGILRRQ